MEKKKKRILIVYTGGTIGMMHSHKSRALVPFNFGEITELIPELKNFNSKIDFHSFARPIDSSNVQPEFWIELAKVIGKNYSKYDGFVILHGTDTMAYSASALSFIFENLSKPIILTGSQLPLGAIRTDAKRNLITTIEIVSGKKIIPEVCIYFNNQLFRGNRAEKFTSSKFDAFQSLNYPVLAEAGSTIEYNRDAILRVPNLKFKIHDSTFNTNVALIKIYPGIHIDVINATLNTKNLKAAIIETYGSGNAPSDKNFIHVLKKAIDNGIILLNISQCSGGRVEQGKYETSIHLKKIGVISGGDMTTEAAMTKLMFLLGKRFSKEEMKKSLGKNLRGELTE
jgi:L-asparaginase